jgi:hypothetical protein
MLLIFAPFIAILMISAIYDAVNRQRRISHLSIENKRLNVLQKDRYELIQSPIMLSAKHQQNTVQASCQNWNHDVKNNNPAKIIPDMMGLKVNNDSEEKSLINQKTANVIYPTITFNAAELELVRAGYILRITGRRKISKNNKNSYITGRKGKIFDVRKIIQVVQKKITNGNFQEKQIDDTIIKLNSLQMGINALTARDELPKDFAIPDDCIVHRTVKNVTYGELKQIAEKEQLTAQLAEFHHMDNIIVKTSQKSKITILKINYKLKHSSSYKH